MLIFRLRFFASAPYRDCIPSRYSNRAAKHFSSKLFAILLAFVFFAASTFAQTASRPLKADLPAENEIRLGSVTQDSNGNMRFLHKEARIETSEVLITADEIEFNSDTNWVTAKGRVHLEHFITGDKVDADHARYNLKTQNGRFYDIDGTAPAKIVASPRVLTTTNPFYFKADWADRIKTRYILHHGFLTDCTIQKSWWVFQAPVFDVIPGQRAIARNTTFRFKGIPIFYLPYFYRPLGKNQRHSGFLTPNFGNSSRFGYIVGAGYYWAINPSYDMTAIGLNYSKRGPALRYDFRGKPNEKTDFDFNLYTVWDGGVATIPGLPSGKQGGTEFELTAKTEIFGFTGRLDYNYLSSYLFRQAFSYSFVTAISSEVYSIGYLQRHFRHDLYTVNLVFQRDQLFNSVTPLDVAPNQVILQKLPSLEFIGRDQILRRGALPLWFSFNSSASVLNRQEPTGTLIAGGAPQSTLGTGALLRLDVEPRVMTEFSFKGFSLNPSVTFGATNYSNSYGVNTTTYSGTTPTSTVTLANANLFRKDVDLLVEFRVPTLERVFQPPKWLHLGTLVKHVVEVGGNYEYLTGISQFQKTIRFDTTDLRANTSQLSYQLVNRFYRKDKTGEAREFLTWRLAQQQYFNPTFSGAVIAGQRNVVLSTEEFSPFAFLDGPRSYSPVISSLTVSPYNFFSVDWRSEFDPKRGRFVDHSISGSARYRGYFFNLGDTAITTNPLLVPQANQLSFGGGYGSSQRRGWNAAGTITYDLRVGQRLYSFVQGSYNTDCCGFTLQWRRFNLGIRNDNQYLFSFSVANIGNFGSLQKQGNIF